jgi:hypothetical protein
MEDVFAVASDARRRDDRTEIMHGHGGEESEKAP